MLFLLSCKKNNKNKVSEQEFDGKLLMLLEANAIGTSSATQTMISGFNFFEL